MIPKFIVPSLLFASVIWQCFNFGDTRPRFVYDFINCGANDDEIVFFKECGLKLIDRNRRECVVVMQLKQNITECTLKVRLMKRLNGWRPFLYDFTVEACDFFKIPKRYKILNTAYGYGKYQTNAHHKCPYLKDEIITINMEEPGEDYIINMLKKFPLDLGRYGFFVDFYVKDKLRGSVNTSVTYSDYRKVN